MQSVMQPAPRGSPARVSRTHRDPAPAARDSPGERPWLEQKPHSCLHAATCGSHVSGSRLLLPPGLLLPRLICALLSVPPGGGFGDPSVTDLIAAPMALQWLSLLDVHD